MGRAWLRATGPGELTFHYTNQQQVISPAATERARVESMLELTVAELGVEFAEVLLDSIAIHLAHACRVRRAEEEFRALVDNAVDVVARLDRTMRHVYVNPAIEGGPWGASRRTHRQNHL